jgi:hypothetical protein
VTVQALGLAASLACSAAFFVFAAVLAATRRSPAPPTLPAMSVLGPQTPAVANLLANGGTVTPDAVPATLLDLAARRVVKIDESADGTYTCRLTAQGPSSLTPYEDQVLALLRRRAVDGVVPAKALTAGPAEEASGWMRNFRSKVVAEASKTGMCVPRWPPRAVAVLAGLALGAFVLAAYSGNESSMTWPEAVAIGVSILVAVVLVRVFRDDAQMVTPAGVDAQARWLSLRHYLHDDELFSSLPPTAVAVRDRFMAYGAALGVAAAAVRAIPMGAESDKWAWSRYGGRWRQVYVLYPGRWPPAWGSSPGQAASQAAWLGAFGLFWLWVSSLLLPKVEFGPHADQLTRLISAGTVLVAAASLLAVCIALWLLLAAMVGLVWARQVTGEAIRIRGTTGEEGARAYIAVYEGGSADYVRAWVAAPRTLSSVHEYDVVTVKVAPFLGYVSSARHANVSEAKTASPAPGAAG